MEQLTLLFTLFLWCCLLPMTTAFDDVDVEKLHTDILERVKRQTGDSGNVCAQADIVFVVDSSGSIKEENWLRVLNFTATVVQSFPVGEFGARFGLVKYGNQARVEFFLDQYTTVAEYVNHIENMKWLDQATNTSGGIWRMYNDVFVPAKGDRPGVPNVGIVITDGESNQDPQLTIPRADEARRLGITLFALGIGPEIDEVELRGIANKPVYDASTGRNLTFAFTVIGFDALNSISTQLVAAACEAAAACQENGDITFILDGSGSVRQANFELMKAFIGELLNEINVGFDESHVAVVTFSDKAEINFGLGNKSENRKSVRDAIAQIGYPRGTTQTHQALDLVRTQVYGQAGDRTGIKDIVVLFTDGGSDNFTLTIEAARKARLAGLYLLVVAVTDMINLYEVREIASDPDSLNVFMAGKFDTLATIQAALKRALCNDNNECNQNSCANGGTCIDGINMHYCQCTAGWAGADCQISCRQPKDIAFVMDASPSIGKKHFYEMESFVKLLVYALPVDSEVHSTFGLETYASTPRIEFAMNAYRYKRDVMNAISLDWQTQGSTNTGAALRMLANNMYTPVNGDRSSAGNVAIFMSDGHSVNRQDTFQAAQTVKDKGITVLTVGMGVTFKYNIMELQGISSDPDANTMFIGANYTELVGMINNIVQAVCNDEDNCNPNPCNGGQCIDRIGSYECVCPQGRSGVNCERSCDGRLDLIFLVDNSGSIRASRFHNIFKPMLKQVIGNLEVASGRTRIGLATFSASMNVEFQLNTFTRKEDVLQAVEMLEFRAGLTNVADALMTVRTNMFTSGSGDRDTVPNVLVILTDGVPTMNIDRTLPEAILVRQQGIHVIVAAAEMKATNLYLKGLASDPDSANIIAVERFTQLLDNIGSMVSATCDDVNECSSNPCRNNGQCLNGLSQYVCDCQDQFTGRNCERACTRQRDIVLILDSSGSMEQSFDLMMQLAKEIVFGLNFKGSRTRVGLVTYSDSATVRFYMNEHLDRTSVLNAIAFLQQFGKTHTASALTLTDQDMFTAFRGDRAGVNNLAILMTDGFSNVNAANTIPSATTLKNSGVRVLSIGVGSNYDLTEINGISSDPDQTNTFVVPTQQEINNVVNNVLEQICQ